MVSNKKFRERINLDMEEKDMESNQFNRSQSF